MGRFQWSVFDMGLFDMRAVVITASGCFLYYSLMYIPESNVYRDEIRSLVEGDRFVQSRNYQ